MILEETKLKDNSIVKHNEYYTMQGVFDKLYEKSRNNSKFKNLLKLITKEENIVLAYRNIKRNKGSNTSGTDNQTVKDYENMEANELVEMIQNSLKQYKPRAVRRVEIPKPNGKKRPLGIPCFKDRLIQQCIKQILEPICEAKFHNHSYGFRPNRSCENAMARCSYLVNNAQLLYTVDVDIKGFFDNVNHGKLLKQLWTLGIQDKTLLSIIKEILKGEIAKIGFPEKGTPQGGIISPLLANVVLNEIDWWLSSQWETFKSNHKYGKTSTKYRALKESRLKEFFFVRYADDIKIFCRTRECAEKIKFALTKRLKNKFSLEISEDKTTITNLKKKNSKYLGFRFKAMWNKEKKKFVFRSHMDSKAIENATKKINSEVRKVIKEQSPKNVVELNTTIIGLHEYYEIATMANKDFNKIYYKCWVSKKKMIKRISKKVTQKELSEINKNCTYSKRYKDYRKNIRKICNIIVYPIYGIKLKIPRNFTQSICNYTKKGRETFKKISPFFKTVLKYLKQPEMLQYRTIEEYDNRISLFVGQQGKSGIKAEWLDIENMELHHKKPKSLGGTDDYSNLIWLTVNEHKLIHAKENETINKYLKILNLNKKELSKVNKLRKLAGNELI